MRDVEVLNRGKGVQGGVTDLLDGRELPIWFSAPLKQVTVSHTAV